MCLQMFDSKDEPLSCHANFGDNAAGVDTNRDGTLAHRGAVETGE